MRNPIFKFVTSWPISPQRDPSTQRISNLGWLSVLGAADVYIYLYKYAEGKEHRPPTRCGSTRAIVSCLLSAGARPQTRLCLLVRWKEGQVRPRFGDREPDDPTNRQRTVKNSKFSRKPRELAIARPPSSLSLSLYVPLGENEAAATAFFAVL